MPKAKPLALFVIVLLAMAHLLVRGPSETQGAPLELRWRVNTVDFRIGVSCLGQRAWDAEILKAARVWNNGGSPFRFNWNDGQLTNGWSCVDHGPDQGFIAVTSYSVDGEGYMSQADANLNTYYAYGVGEPDKYDVWAVAAHEFGHWLYAGHTADTEATMYCCTSAGETKWRILSQRDMDEIRALYSWDGNKQWDFNVTGDREGWTAINFAWNNGVAYDPGADSGAWIGVPNNDPQFLSQYDPFDASTYRYLIVRMADQNAASNRWFQLYWDNGSGFSEALHTDFDFWTHQNNPEGGPNIWATYSIDLYNRHSGWRGNVRQVRFDPILASNGLPLGVDFIRFATRMGNLPSDCSGPPDC